MDEPRRHTENRAEMAGHRRQGGAEQPRQLQGRVVGLIVHTVSPQPYPQHHRNDVPGVLAEGGKPHNGENAAQSRAVDVAVHQQNIRYADQAVEADVDENSPRAEHAEIIVGSPARGGQQQVIPLQHILDPLIRGEQAHEDQHHADHGAGKAQFRIAPGGPVHGGVRLVTEGRQHRHHHHGEQAAGKAHVVEVHTVLHLVGIGRKRGHQKAHDHAG